MAFISAVVYFVISYRVILPYFYKFNYPLNSATKFLVASSFLSFAVILYFFGSAAVDVYRGFCEKDYYFSLKLFWLLILIALALSILIFHFSAVVVQITLKENEKAELAKNNFQVAGFHGIVHLFFTLLISEKVVQIILSYFN
jgi:hypothetical protein